MNKGTILFFSGSDITHRQRPSITAFKAAQTVASHPQRRIHSTTKLLAHTFQRRTDALEDALRLNSVRRSSNLEATMKVRYGV